MDHFSRIYKVTQPKQKKRFAEYLKAEADDSRVLELFTLITGKKNRSTAEIAQILYNDATKTDNVRRNRKNLTDLLIDFIAADRLNTDSSVAGFVRKMLNVAEFLVERLDPELARHFLDTAEEKVSRMSRYDLMESIFHFRLLHAEKLGIDSGEAYLSWKKNHSRYNRLMHLLGAERMLHHQLSSYRLKGIVPDQAVLMDDFYERFAPSQEERLNPGYMSRLAAIFRKVMITTKDYWRIEPAVAEMYELLERNGRFTEEEREAQMGFLAILAQAAYRNRHFETAEKHLDVIQRLLPSPVPRNHPYYVKMVSLRAAIFGYTNRYREAIRILQQCLSGDQPIQHEEERCQMQFNLALCTFCDQDYQGALQHMLAIERSDKWLFDRFGVEWIYKKQMVTVILLWESGQYESAAALLNKMLHDYGEFLKQEIYQRAKQFMHFVLRYFEEPDLIREVSFHREIRDAKISWGEKEDIHAILFFCWLRAKMLGRPFYPVLQARLRGEGDNWDYPFNLKD
jgi:tetratricopeptide (TPR) repeat protein